MSGLLVPKCSCMANILSRSMCISSWTATLLLAASIAICGLSSLAQSDPDTVRLLTQNGGPMLTFEGQVVAMRASDVGPASPSQTNAVVKVISIIDAPPYFTRFKGQQVTVVLRQPNELPLNGIVIFYATGATVGKEITVRELFHSDIDKGNPKLILDQLRQFAGREALRLEAQQTPVIVSGKVLTIKQISSSGPASEHEGGRMIATIIVESVIKSKSAAPVQKSQRISVIFADPNDRDISVVASPRFTVGQRGIWLLRKLSGSDRYGLGPAGNSASIFKAPGAADFQDLSKLDTIRAVLQ